MAAPTKAGDTASHLPAELEARAERARPLDAALRGSMERSFGTSLGDVVVHTDADAAASAEHLDAKAYAVGRHVVFGPGRYDPHSTAGRALIGHELAHVVQQRRGGPRPGPRGVHPSGTAAEGAAHTAGARAAAGLSAPVAGGTAPGVSRAPKNEAEEEAERAELRENRAAAMVALGATEGVALEVTGAVDTLIGLGYGAHDAGRLGVRKAASLLGLSGDQTTVVQAWYEGASGGFVLDAVRDRAKAAGLVDPYTGVPALSPGVTKAGDLTEAYFDRVSGGHAPDDGSLFSDRELTQIAVQLGVKTILAYTGGEEVLLALKVLGVASSVEAILNAINANPEGWPSDSRFWLQVVGAVLNVAGLAASSAGKRLAALLLDAALATLSTAPAVRKLWVDWKGAHGPDRDAVLEQDLKDVVRALIAVMHQILLHAAGYRRSKAPGGGGTEGGAGREHAGPPVRQPQPAADAHAGPPPAPAHAGAGTAPAGATTAGPATPAPPAAAPAAAPKPAGKSGGKSGGVSGGAKAPGRKSPGRPKTASADPKPAPSTTGPAPIEPAPGTAAPAEATTSAAKPTGAKATTKAPAAKTPGRKAPARKAPARKPAGKKAAARKATPEKTAAERKTAAGSGSAEAGRTEGTPVEPTRRERRQLVKDVRARAKALRAEARKDPSAVDRLRDLYEGQPDHVLGALSDDPVAAQVRDRRRARQQKDELARIDASDFRPPHEATVRVLDPDGSVVHNESLRSGGVTPEQRAARGLNRANQDSHTEAKAVTRVPLTAGQRMYITGQYDPCGSCRAAMQAAALRSGGRINYWWPGGPPEGIWFPLGSGGAR
ncbi:eCIS core domain-containing protein [Embleya hyalina]|uniref:eCIS core domain-containing protein n=1 Tax=Embleya hyalina TaxID=516124 RepID=A0A401YQ31_9ACTN|nr:DUF4157 domain-containing protein [Embleya hyalina]GCD96701.1 hypothetical protein EHYA_04388 [Embleya hyalina]